MLTHALRTTALVSLTLMPVPGLAQEAPGACLDLLDLPCTAPGGEVLDTPAALRDWLSARGVEEPQTLIAGLRAGDETARSELAEIIAAERVTESGPAADDAAATTEAGDDTVGDDIPEVDSDTAETAPEETVADDIPEVASETPPADDDAAVAGNAAEEEAEAAPPAAAAAAETEEADTAAEVVEEAVSEEDVRTADEDFETAVGDEAAPSDDDDDLSDFQRALLLGLGAVAVGSILASGDEVVSNTGDRLVVQDQAGDLRVLKNDDVLLRQAGNDLRTETFADGSTRTTVVRQNGARIVTIRGADGTVLRRTRINPDGREVMLFDDTAGTRPVVTTALPLVETTPEARASDADRAAIRAALLANLRGDVDRTFTLQQIRTIDRVRDLAPEVALDNVNFATGSAAIDADGAAALVELGLALGDIVADDPDQVFLIEGHTDAVGDEGYNLALSDRRAETVALALIEVFDLPPENIVTQGYGESDLLIETEEGERANRRAAVRNITALLR